MTKPITSIDLGNGWSHTQAQKNLSSPAEKKYKATELLTILSSITNTRLTNGTESTAITPLKARKSQTLRKTGYGKEPRLRRAHSKKQGKNKQTQKNNPPHNSKKGYKADKAEPKQDLSYNNKSISETKNNHSISNSTLLATQQKSLSTSSTTNSTVKADLSNMQNKTGVSKSTPPFIAKPANDKTDSLYADFVKGSYPYKNQQAKLTLQEQNYTDYGEDYNDYGDYDLFDLQTNIDIPDESISESESVLLKQLNAKGVLSNTTNQTLYQSLPRLKKTGKLTAVMVLGELSADLTDDQSICRCFHNGVGWKKLSTLQSRSRRTGIDCVAKQQEMISKFGESIAKQLSNSTTQVTVKDSLNSVPGILLAVDYLQLSSLLNNANLSTSSIKQIDVVDVSPEDFYPMDPAKRAKRTDKEQNSAYSNEFDDEYWKNNTQFLACNGAEGLTTQKDKLGHNLTGENQTVALFDQGVEAQHPWFDKTNLTSVCFLEMGLGHHDELKTICRGKKFADNTIVAADSQRAYQHRKKDPVTAKNIRLSSHGTTVASAISGGIGNHSSLTSAPNLISMVADIVTKSSEGTFSNWGLAKAMDWVATHGKSHNISALSLSVKMPPSVGVQSLPCNHSLFNMLTKTLTSQGITVVTAAGNDGIDLKKVATFPQCLEDVIVVGQMNSNEKIAMPHSNNGEWVDMFSVPETILARQPSARRDLKIQSENLLEASGTSIATPVVASAIAILKQQITNCNCSHIKTTKHSDAVKWSLWHMEDLAELPSPDGHNPRANLNLTQAIKNMDKIINRNVDINNLPGSNGGRPITKAKDFYANIRAEKARYMENKQGIFCKQEADDHSSSFQSGNFFVPLITISSLGLLGCVVAFQCFSKRTTAIIKQEAAKANDIEMAFIGEFED